MSIETRIWREYSQNMAEHNAMQTFMSSNELGSSLNKKFKPKSSSRYFLYKAKMSSALKSKIQIKIVSKQLFFLENKASP